MLDPQNAQNEPGTAVVQSPDESAPDVLKSLGFDVPRNICADCGIGVLRLISYDPLATHERGQPIYYPTKLSGGSVSYECPACGVTSSLALDPHDAPPDPRPGA